MSPTDAAIITIITTLDKEGKINAAPYSHIMQYDVMTKNPRMIVGFRQDSHTFQNICATKEFVVNCPTADYLDDMMETARFYPEGVNELEHTRFTMIPSLHVKPPTIKECPQIAECEAEEIIRLDKSSGIVIARIKALVFDEELIDMGREERIRKMNLPIGLGDEDRQDYFHTTLGHISMHQLGETPDAFKGGEVRLGMTWDADALQSLMTIPPDLDAAFRKFIPPFGAAGNPVDITGGEPPKTYQNTIRLGLEEPRIHALILGYWHTIITPPMVFAKLVVEVVEEMRAKGIEKPVVASCAGDVQVEEAAEYLFDHGIPAYPYSTEMPVMVLGAKYKWARGAGLI